MCMLDMGVRIFWEYNVHYAPNSHYAELGYYFPGASLKQNPRNNVWAVFLYYYYYSVLRRK